MNNTRTMIQKEQIEKAVAVLKAGGVILYPTDTIWASVVMLPMKLP